MSEPQAGSAQLRAVPAGAATAATTAASADGLTPPQPRGGSRFITDVVVEMGFLARDRVEPMVERAKLEGRPPEQVLLEAGAITGDQLARATAQRLGFTTWTSRCSRRT